MERYTLKKDLFKGSTLSEGLSPLSTSVTSNVPESDEPTHFYGADDALKRHYLQETD